MPEILYSSIFGALTQHVQARFDAASKLHKQLFDNVIFERFLDWDTPTIGLDFEEIIGQYNITVAAPTIGDQSERGYPRYGGVGNRERAHPQSCRNAADDDSGLS